MSLMFRRYTYKQNTYTNVLHRDLSDHSTRDFRVSLRFGYANCVTLSLICKRDILQPGCDLKGFSPPREIKTWDRIMLTVARLK